MNKLTEQEEKIVKSHAFAQIMSSQVNKDGFAEISYCPLQLRENNQLLGHLARNNPLFKVINDTSVVKVIFSGPHGYISPRWHSEQVVPTWNYASVSLTCNINIINSSSEKSQAIQSLSKHFDPQWDFNEFNREGNERMVQQMLSAITVFTLDIVDVKSKFKLSQQRSTACREALQENLQQTGYQELAEIQLW